METIELSAIDFDVDELVNMLLFDGRWFEATPYPDGEWRFRIKKEPGVEGFLDMLDAALVRFQRVDIGC